MLQLKNGLDQGRTSTGNRLKRPAKSRFRPSVPDLLEARLLLATSVLSIAPGSVIYGGNTTLQATLTSGSTPLVDANVNLMVGSNDLGIVATNSSGVATFSDTTADLLHVGVHAGELTATFAGNVGYAGSSGSAALTVTPATLTITAAPRPRSTGPRCRRSPRHTWGSPTVKTTVS